MSRSGYSDECVGVALARWRASVTRAIRGKRGQAFLRELLEALDRMPEKRLIPGRLRNEDGQVCAMGAVCVRRGLEIPDLDGSGDDYRREVGKLLGIAPALAAEIANINDDPGYYEARGPGARRWARVRGWVARQIREEAT